MRIAAREPQLVLLYIIPNSPPNRNTALMRYCIIDYHGIYSFVENGEEMTAMRIAPYERSAQYYETDQMGIVHHSNYIRWFEEARVYLLNQCGLPYKEMERRGVWIPVLGVSCEYRRPVRFEDVVLIEMRVENFVSTHGLKFVTKYRVTGKETGELLTTGETRHCLTGADMRPIRCERVQPEVYEVFKALEASAP